MWCYRYVLFADGDAQGLQVLLEDEQSALDVGLIESHHTEEFAVDGE
jgi:hypothetical protein